MPARRSILVGLLAVSVVLWLVFRNQFTIVPDDSAPLFKALNGVRDWIQDNRTTNPLSVFLFEPIRASTGAVLEAVQGALHGLTWLAALTIVACLGALAGGWRLALLAFTGFGSLGVLGLWSESLDTISLTITAVVMSLVAGIPLGIVAGRSRRFRAVISPVLDVMQIMPTFAYLAPMILFFGIGTAPGTIATIIYAVPATIRITALGIVGVPAVTVEAATSIGSTRWQLLSKVQLPLARRAIGLAINQTIMLALSMVVITALIGSPGLGESIVKAVSALDVGRSLQAGIAIVIVAILLDRLTGHANELLDPRGRRPVILGLSGRRLVLGAIVVSAASIVIGSYVADPNVFPDAVSVSIRQPVNDLEHWIVTNLFFLTSTFKDGFTAIVIQPIETVLVESPWWLVVAVVAILSWLVSGRRSAVLAGLCLVAILGLQLWQDSMTTLANVLVGTAITLAIGLVFGILSARRPRFGAFLKPLLDAAQTLPAFVYLVPALALFQFGRFTAIVAAVIFAAPPVIRLVEVGIRTVPETVIEAATSVGATSGQILRKVQLPMARRAILLAANQGIIQVLAMVVVGGLVGAGALGFDVVSGFSQSANFGSGLAAGTSTVLLGIMLDRITQGAGEHGRATPQVRKEAG